MRVRVATSEEDAGEEKTVEHDDAGCADVAEHLLDRTSQMGGGSTRVSEVGSGGRED
jgi:hypothetical protein